MKTKDFLVKLAKVVDDLDANGFHQEAYFLNNEYIKIAQSELVEEKPDSNLADEALEVAGAASIAKNVLKKNSPKIKPGRPSLKGFGYKWLLDLGADYAIDFFESSQGPYKVYTSNKSDLDKIIKLLYKLIPDSSLNGMLDNLQKIADDGLAELNSAKTEIKTAYKLKENFNYKFAIRGNFEEELPSYLTEFLKDAVTGGAAGALVSGGAAALPAALISGVGGVLTKAGIDIWYANLSSTGKAYLQSKDLKMKASKMQEALNDIDMNLANQLVDQTTEILEYIEQKNLNNKDKNELEKLVQKAEEYIGVAGNKIVDKALPGISQVKDKLLPGSQSSFEPSRSERIRIL